MLAQRPIFLIDNRVVLPRARIMHPTAGPSSIPELVAGPVRRPAQTKVLVFDGDCPMCLGAIAWLTRSGLVSRKQTVSHHDLPPEELEIVRAAGIRNQLVVLDRSSNETRIGSDGLLWIVGDNPQYRWLARLLSLPVARQLLRFGYEAVSYNRRIISPPQHRIACDCEPEVTTGRRLMLILPALVVAVMAFAVCGAAFAPAFDIDPGLAGLALVLSKGIAIVALSMVIATAGRGHEPLQYVGHFSLALVSGSLVLVPFCLLAAFAPPNFTPMLGIAAAVAALAVIFWNLTRRTRAANLKPTIMWSAALAWAVAFFAALAVMIYGLAGA
jgi:predicted DCC family thiol-disulfide oxidoreductase YuxK